jgi:predicted phage tail protein
MSRRWGTSGISIAAGVAVSALWFTSCTSQPSYCADRAAAQQSWQELTGTDVIEDGTATLRDRFRNFSGDVETLAESAQDEFQPEIDALRDSLQQMEGVLQDVAGDPATAAPQVRPAIEDLESSTENLLGAVDQACQ